MDTLCFSITLGLGNIYHDSCKPVEVRYPVMTDGSMVRSSGEVKMNQSSVERFRSGDLFPCSALKKKNWRLIRYLAGMTQMRAKNLGSAPEHDPR